jgi:ankyrin repeat protein
MDVHPTKNVSIGIDPYPHLEIARVLVEAGAKKHQPRTDGFTALHLAACKGRLDIVQLLIEPSADTDITMDHVSTASLVGGFKHGFHFPFHIWDNPSI